MAGRGANHNVEHRFSGPQIETVDDGWSQSDWDAAFAASAPRTEVTEISAAASSATTIRRIFPSVAPSIPIRGASLTSSPTLALRVTGGGFPLLGDSCSRSTGFLLHRAA